jgi:hypothetical protein
MYLQHSGDEQIKDHLYRVAIALAAILQYQYCSRSAVLFRTQWKGEKTDERFGLLVQKT